MTMESWEWGDPADVIDRRRGRTCHGCKHLRIDTTPGYGKIYCAKGKVKSAQRVELMAKCKEFSLDR